MIPYRNYFTLLLCFTVLACSGQIEVRGEIREQGTDTPLSYIQVTIHAHESKKLTGYAFSDKEGRFSIILPGPGIYELKTHGLSHSTAIQPIVIVDEETETINLPIVLQAKTIELAGVEVKATRPPLVVRGDTLLYAAAAFTDEADQTLEDVLRKIPGLEVLSNGELKVRGKNVDRILINGEALTDASTALLTRGIDPRLVRDVEIRMNDRDEKLRRSLLDQNGLVVLDIKLKDDVGKRFGRLGLGGGYERQTGAAPGGLLNGFSLSKKANWHLLGEYDRFGNQTINLKDVKNLGREAYAAIFDVPADFNRLRENPEFDKELYGFKEGTSFEQGTLGLSGAINLGANAKLFLGSYNVLDRSAMQNTTRLRLLADNVEQHFVETENYQTWSSKNKVEYALDLPSLKLRYNFNAVLTDDTFASQQTEAETIDRSFKAKESEYSLYHNLFFEKRLSSGNGFRAEVLYSSSSLNTERTLTDPSDALRPLLPREVEFAQPLVQLAPVVNHRLLLNSFYHLVKEGLGLQVGLRVLDDELTASKDLLIGGISTDTSAFSAASTTLRYTQWRPYLNTNANLGVVSWKGKVGYAFNTYSTFNGRDSQVRNLLEINGNLSLAIGEDELSFGYSRTTSQFPLLQQMVGIDLLDARTIGRGGIQTLRPQPESLLRLSFSSWALEDLGLGVEVAGIAGRSRATAGTFFEIAPFVTESYDQLTTEYAVASVKVAKVFSQLPVQLRAEHSRIFSRQQNRLSDDRFFDATGMISISKLAAKTIFKEQPFNFSLDGKRSAITFGDELSDASRQLIISSLAFAPTTYLCQRKLLLTATVRYVNFSGTMNSNVLLADLNATFRINNIGLQVSADNLFDAESITTQNIIGGIYSQHQRLLFGRSLRASASINL